MAKCTFCGNTIEKGTGMMHVLTEGKVLYFCSSKCRKNMLKLKRAPRYFKWTKHYEKGRLS